MKRFFLIPCSFMLLLYLSALGNADEMVFLNILDMSSGPNSKVRMIVSILDEQGRPIKSLGYGNFKLLIEGKEISNFIIKPISSADSPLSVILAIDLSGSMNGKPISEAKRAGAMFIDRLGNDDNIALIGFGSSVKMVADFTKKKHEIREKLESLDARDQLTLLYQASYDCLEKAAKAPTSRVAIVLLTDGKDEGSPLTEEDILRRIKGTQFPIYTLGFGEKAQVNYLKKIATASGGFFLFTPNSEELIHLYGKLLEQIKNQYQIEFTFDNPPGVYNANLKFDYQGKEVRAQRRFAHVSMEPAIPPSPPVNPPLVATSAPWFATAWPWVPLLLVISIAGFSLLYLYLRRQSETPRLKADEAKSGPASMMAKGKIHPLSSSADKFVTSRATVIFQTPGEVGLRIDIPPVPIFFPLIDRKNNKNYEAVIITRYDDADRKFFSEKHNYILLGDNTVSRPDGNRLGHARIFLDPDTNRYQIEDLGSSGGTSLGENPLTGKIVLENRDTITVGAVSINFYDKRPTTETIF